MKTLLIRSIAVLISLLICIISLKFYLEKQETDIRIQSGAFIYWSIPLILGTVVSGSSILYVFRKRSFLFRILMIAMCSIGISLLWQFGLEQLVNMQPGAYQEPLLYTWAGTTFIELMTLEFLLKKSNDKKEMSTLVLGLLSFPLITIVSVFALSFVNSLLISATPPLAETYLIPSDLKGEFRVVYNEKKGIEPKIVNDRRIMMIPENGVLIVKSAYPAGTINQEFYLVSKSGSKKQVTAIRKYEDRNKTTGVLCYGPGISMQQDQYRKLEVKSLDFTLYRKNERVVNDGDYSALDSITAMTVNRLRTK